MGSELGDLETLVLQNALDGGIFTAGRQLGLEDDTERAIADDLALRVLHLFCLSGQAILDLFANYLCDALVCRKGRLMWRDGGNGRREGRASACKQREGARRGEVIVSLPPMRKLENAEGLFCDMIARGTKQRNWLEIDSRGSCGGDGGGLW